MNIYTYDGQIDLTSGRTQRYRVHYSTRPAPRAVVALAPGWGGNETDYAPLAERLVARGMTVGVCDFADSRNPGTEALRDDEQRVMDFREFCDRRPEWLSYPHGLRQYWDGIMAKSWPLAVIGHSAGSKCAQGAAGALYESLGPLGAVAGLGACVAMSPQGVDSSSETTPTTPDTISVPILYGTGTDDPGERTDDPWQWRMDQYYTGINTPRHLYVLDGGTHQHGGLTGRAPVDAGGEAAADLIADYILAYAAGSWWAQASMRWALMVRPAEFAMLEGFE